MSSTLTVSIADVYVSNLITLYVTHVRVYRNCTLVHQKNKQHLYNDVQTGQWETAVAGRILVTKESTSLQTMTKKTKTADGVPE